MLEGYLEVAWPTLAGVLAGILICVFQWGPMKLFGNTKGFILTGVIMLSLIIGFGGHYKQQQIDAEKQKTGVSNGTR